MKTPHAYLIWMWRSNTQKQHIISSMCEWYIMISYAAKSCATKRMLVKPFSMGCGYHPQPFRMDQASWQVVHWPTLRWAYLGVFSSEVEGVAKKQGNTPPQYSGKIDQNWAWPGIYSVFIQCFVCIIIPGPELQKYAKLVFHPEQLGFLVFMDMSVDELV